MFKDIDYTISLLNSNKSSWEENKTKVLIDLRENLDSGLREELIGITNATGSGLQWTTIDNAIAAIRAIIHNKKFVHQISMMNFYHPLNHIDDFLLRTLKSTQLLI